MKGISHFSVGVAWASCFAEAVRAGADGNPLYFVLGGIFGLLPDTLDFKFWKFLSRQDIEVVPDPLAPDPRQVAAGLAFAFNRAFAGKVPVRIKLCTMRLGCDLWRQYSVRFDVAQRLVTVSIGPVVRTDLTVVAGWSGGGRSASAGVACGIRPDYEVETTIDILDGPMFEMQPCADGRVAPVFIPWHRSWSHSFVVGLLFALVGGVLWGPLAGVVVLGAYSLHIGLDQFGFMGSNLWFPFRHKGRSGGLKFIHSADMAPNFSTVWLSCLVVFWNLYSSAELPGFSLNPVKMVFWLVVLPLCIFRLVHRVRA